MKWVLLVLGVVVGIGVLLTAIGALLPRDHVAASRATIPAAPAAIFDAITTIDSFPSWRSDVTKVELLEPRDGHPRWRETSGFGPIVYERTEADTAKRVVSRVDDEGEAFGGTWTYDIEGKGSGSLVTITERGFVKNPLFRFLSRFVFGHYGAQETYLRALGTHFGDSSVQIERL